MKLAEAIKILSTTHRSLDTVALTLIVDANEVHEALAKAEAGTVEELCLQHLARVNLKPKAKKEA
jgi:hypothetical protein